VILLLQNGVELTDPDTDPADCSSEQLGSSDYASLFVGTGIGQWGLGFLGFVDEEGAPAGSLDVGGNIDRVSLQQAAIDAGLLLTHLLYVPVDGNGWSQVGLDGISTPSGGYGDTYYFLGYLAVDLAINPNTSADVDGTYRYFHSFVLAVGE